MPAKPERTRRIANLEIIQPEDWRYVSTADSACRLTPEFLEPAEFLSIEVWEHAVIKRIPFLTLFEDFVASELSGSRILSAGQTERGYSSPPTDTLGRTVILEEDGASIHYLFTGIKRGREMYMARVRFSSLPVFARYRADLERILPETMLPGLNMEDPPESNLTARRLEDVEITIPHGWDYRAEASSMASIFNKELAEINDPNEFIALVLTAESGRWWRYHPSPEAGFRSQTEKMMSKVVEGGDSGYVRGTNAGGLDTLTRRTRYRYTATRILHWDHVGLWKDRSSATVSIRYSDPEIYERFRNDIDLLIDSVRFTHTDG